MKTKKNFSVSAKLAFRFTFILSAVEILMTITFSRIQIADLNYQRSQELNISSTIMSRNYDKFIQETPTAQFKIERIPKHLNYLIYKKNENSTQTITTNSEEIPPLKITNQKSKIYSQKRNNENDIKIIYIARPMEHHPEIIMQVWIDLQNDSVYQIRHRMPKIILAMLFPTLIICYFIAWFIARKIMKPVIKMTEGAKKISSSNLDSLLPEKNNGDELDELAKTFNDLFKRLKIDFDRERQFTSDVSHELKTPVAVILGQANLLRRWGKNDPLQLDKSIATIISETKSMEAIIQNLLQMTRIESGRILPTKEEFLLKELFDKIKEEILILDATAQITFDFDDNLKVFTDYELLHQTLMICISNSLKFCQKPVSLIFSAKYSNSLPDKENCSNNNKRSTVQNNITICVTDNGLGFSPEIINHVFERFYRGDDAHTRNVGGSGLGLSIAKTIIQSLGGDITASNDEKTGGAKLSIELN